MPNMTPTQKAEALAVYHDAIVDATEHAREFLSDLGATRQHLEALAHKLAVAFVACEMFVDETEIEAVLAEDRRNAAVADAGPANDLGLKAAVEQATPVEPPKPELFYFAVMKTGAAQTTFDNNADPSKALANAIAYVEERVASKYTHIENDWCVHDVNTVVVRDGAHVFEWVKGPVTVTIEKIARSAGPYGSGEIVAKWVGGKRVTQ